MGVLLVAPADDRTARRASMIAHRLASRFHSLPARKTRNRAEADRLLSESRDLIYFGHGEPDALIASPRRFQAKARLFDPVNLACEPGRVVVAVACWSGEVLGRAVTDPGSVEEPIAAYIGWLDEVGWPPGLAEPIDNALVEGLSSLLEGSSVSACRAALEAAFERAHERYRAEASARISKVEAHLGKMHAMYWRARIATYGDETAELAL